MPQMSTPYYPYASNENFRSDVAPVTKGYQERVLSRYIGEQLTTNQPNQHDRLPSGARNYPDMFRNRSLQLQDTIEGFILDGFEWYTYIIPWLVTNEKHVKMNVYKHNVRPATPTPNKGVSRTQTSSTSTKEATVERFGIAFYMEGDMMGTPEGDRQYIRNLMGLAQGCQLLVNEATMAEIIDCKNYVQDWMDLRGRKDFLEDVMNMEISRFAGMAADPNFLEQVVQQSISAFSLRSIVPGAIIGWETMPFLQSMVVAGSRTGFWQLGPDGHDVFVQGPDSVTTILKLPLFVARPFIVNEQQGPEQFLARETTVGEYYPMSFNDRRGEFFGPGGSTYNSNQRTIRIYDIDTDSWKDVTLKEALANSRIWHTNPGDYTEELKQAVIEANIEASEQDAFAEKALRYANPAALDHPEKKFTRKENMFFSHEAQVRRMYLPTFIGQFDTDVVQTNDLLQMAHQFVRSMFGATWDGVQTEIARARDFVHRWETEARDNNGFWDDLASTNAARSVSAGGQWIGEQVAAGAPRDWVPNATSSLDLPIWDASYGQFPPGFANYWGLETLIAQGREKNYPAETIAGARTTNTLVEKVTRQANRVGGRSRIAQAAASPEWFHIKKPELATWEMLFGRRAPIFLAAPNQIVGNADATAGASVKRRDQQVPRYNTVPGKYQLYGTLPSGALLAGMVGAAKESQTVLNNLVQVLKDVVEALPANPSDADIAKNESQEEARTKTIVALIKRINQFGKRENNKYQTYYAALEVSDILGLDDNGVVNVDDAYREKFARLANAQTVKLNRTKVDEKAQEYDRKYAAEDSSRKQTINRIGGVIAQIGYGDIETTDLNTNLAPDFVNKKAELKELLVPTETRLNTPMTDLLNATEKVEKLGRKYGDFSWDKLESWSTAVASNLVPEAAVELSSAINDYHAANAEVGRLWNNVFATGPKKLDEDEDEGEPELGVRRPGEEIQSSRHFFRAPLSMTRTLLYTSSENSDPRVLAADPDTGFRTIFYPQRAPQTRFADDPISAMGQLPFMLDVGMKELHDFKTSSFVQQHLVMPSVDADVNRDYTAPPHIIAAAKKFSTKLVQSNSKIAQKRKAADFAAASEQQDKKRGFGYGDAPQQRKTAMQAVEEEMARGVQQKLAAGKRFRRGDDDDEDHDDKKFLKAGALVYRDGEFVNVDDESAMREDANRARLRREIAPEVEQLQRRPTTTDEYNTLLNGGMLAYRWEKANEQDDVVRMAMLNIVMSRADDYLSQLALVDQNVTLPYNFLIWRLHITISMYSLIVLAPGRETGVNIIGDRNFAIQEQVLDKVVHGHLTFYHKCVIWRPQNIDHLLDIYPQKYRAGWNMRWVEKPEEVNNPSNRERGSLISWIMPLGEQIDKSAVSFIGGPVQRLQPLSTNLPDTSLATSLSMARFYADDVWKVDRARTSYPAEIATFKKSRMQLNVVAFSGKYLAWDEATKSFVLKTQGTGHLRGVKSGPGTQSVWSGQSYKLFPQVIATQSIN